MFLFCCVCYFPGTRPSKFIVKFNTLRGMFDSLGRAKYLPIGDVARLVVQAKHIINDLVLVAQSDDEFVA